MPRLVTFGCSFVYGHGLPDCYMKFNRGAGPNPSKYAWPNLLAKRLGYECVNLSRPGSGNLQIFMEILHTKFLPDDLVIIAWSFFPRFDNYQVIDLKGTGQIISATGPNIFDGMVAKQLKINEGYPEKNFWDNWLTIQHCELFLNSKNIKNFSYIGINEGSTGWFTKINNKLSDKIDVKKVPAILTVNNILEDVPLIYDDFALDMAHPGMNSHRLQEKLIYSKIEGRI